MKPYSEIIVYLKKDEKLTFAINKINEKVVPELNIDIYVSLLESIVSQQLSSKVAKIIWQRFLILFNDEYPQPERLIQLDIATLRSVGLSNSKANYLKNVAYFTIKNELSFNYLIEKSDEEIIEYLTKIKGVGRWTAQMILMFPLDRLDVFPVDDLGIQTKMKEIYQITEEKKDLKIKLLEIAENWKPYRSLACKYLWLM